MKCLLFAYYLGRTSFFALRIFIASKKAPSKTTQNKHKEEKLVIGE